MELKDALLLFYIIMIAGYFEPLFSCDLQRLFTNSLLAKHILAFISAFFLITLVDDKNDIKTLGEMFRTTFMIYALYILSTKAKAYYVLPMLIVLFIDQILKVQVGILEKRESEKIARAGDAAQRERIVKIREGMTWAIVLLILGGMLHYYIRARIEFGAKFSTVAFFAGTKECAHGGVGRRVHSVRD